MRFCLVLFLVVAVEAAWAQEAPAQAAPEQLSPPPPPPESAPPLVPAPAEPEPTPRTPPAWQLSFTATPSRQILLDRGERVRVETAQGQRVDGELVSLVPGALSLQASPEQVLTLLLKDVRELEQRQRAPGYGALVGAGLGGVSGGVLMALVCIAIAEGGDSGAPFCAGLGSLIGGAFGAGVGALVGLAVPRWSTVYAQDEGSLSLVLRETRDDEISHWLSGRGLVGEVGLQFGYARDMGRANPTDGWGGRLHLLALIGPYVAVGPEVAWYNHLGSETVIQPFGQSFHTERSLFELGGLVRGGVDIGPTRTSVLLGLGFQSNRDNQVGVSIGGEVEVRIWKPLPPLAMEVRYHFPVDRNAFEPVQNFLSFGLGSRLRW